MKRLLREPLLHFLALGLGLFLISSLVNEDSPVSRDRILVDEAIALRLAEQFQRAWMRPPTREELQGLAEDYVMEEILYREALALGLDQDDLVIRRRMRQKLEFLNADLVDLREPTEAELQSYLDANPDKFRSPARYSFQQVFLNPRSAAGGSPDRVNDVLARLHAEPEPGSHSEAIGDATLLPPGLENASRREIAETFGERLADAVPGMQPGAWSGPFPSDYGLHLIRVTHVEAARMLPLAEVRAVVERDWSHEQREAGNARFYEALRSRYSIEIRLPPGPGDDGEEELIAAERQ